MARLLFVCGMIFLTAVTACCDEYPDPFGLTRGLAIEMAIRKNIDLQVEAISYRMAESDLARSRGIYDTTLNASSNGGISFVPGDPFFLTRNSTSSIGLTQSIPTGGSISATAQTGFTTAETAETVSSNTDWQSSVGLTFSQPLLKNAGRQAMELGITLAGSSLQDALERFRYASADTVLSVISSYNRLYTLRQTLETKRRAFNSARTLLEEIQKRPKEPAQDMEIANAEYAIAQRRRELVEAERSVRDQEAGLRYLIGLEQKVRIIPLDPPALVEPPETEAQAVQIALELRPDLRQLRLTLKTSELQERNARHQMLPDLSVTASGGLSGTGNTFGKSFNQIGEHPSRFWSAGMQFSFPLGNTYAENDYRRSKLRTDQVRQQIEGLAWRIRNDIEADMRALISARLQLRINEKSRQLAEQRLEEYRKNNRLGSATVQDVINAENDLISARSAQLDAEETFAYAVARLWRDIGVLLERQGVQIGLAHPGESRARLPAVPESQALFPVGAPPISSP